MYSRNQDLEFLHDKYKLFVKMNTCEHMISMFVLGYLQMNLMAGPRGPA